MSYRNKAKRLLEGEKRERQREVRVIDRNEEEAERLKEITKRL